MRLSATIVSAALLGLTAGCSKENPSTQSPVSAPAGAAPVAGTSSQPSAASPTGSMAGKPASTPSSGTAGMRAATSTGGAAAPAAGSTAAGQPAAISGSGAGAPAPAGMSAMPAAGAGAMAMPTAGAGMMASTDPAPPDPSPGCMGGTFKAGHTNETIMVGSSQRTYVQTVPSNYDGKTPYAVVLDFHGGTYDGPRWDSRESNQFHQMGEAHKFIYITPTGLNQWWTTTDGANGADGMFMRALIDRLKKNACVDNRRIYATGCSMGGDMSFYMACYLSDVIAASLPLCGSASFDLNKDCKPTRPISLEFVIGSQDTLNCWDLPRTSVGNPCAKEVQAKFKELNGCTGEIKKTHNGVCETLDQCKEGTEVTICKVNAQHTTIYTNPDFDMYKESWDFLSRYFIH